MSASLSGFLVTSSHLSSEAQATSEQPSTMALPALRIEAATLSDIEEMAALYTDAFDDNAAYCHVFCDQTTPEGKARAFRWLFERRVRLNMNKGCPFFVIRGDDGRIIGSAGLVPEAKKHNILDLVGVGILEWPFLFGLPSMIRALSRRSPKAGPGPNGEEVHPGAELSMVAVHSGARSRGVGSQLVRHVIAHWDETESRACGSEGPLVLSTQKEENLRFYERLEFRLVREEFVLTGSCDGKQAGFKSWDMVRDTVRR